MRSRILAVSGAVLAMLSVGTSSVAAAGPYAYGAVRSTCAPWDGPAVEVRMTTEPTECKPSKGPSLTISVWRGLPLHAGQTVKFGPGSDAGTASRCAKAGDCQSALSGTVVFDRVEDGTVAAGHYEIVFKNDEVVKGTFDATWCSSRPLCG